MDNTRPYNTFEMEIELATHHAEAAISASDEAKRLARQSEVLSAQALSLAKIAIIMSIISFLAALMGVIT